MQIIAQRTGSNYFLVDLGNSRGAIVSIEDGKVYPPRNIQAIIARGYWEPYNGSDEVSKRIMELFPTKAKPVHIVVKRGKNGKEQIH